LPPEPTVLAFDTSAAHCAAALLVEGRLAASRCEELGRGQAERLFPLLEETLAEANIRWKDIELIGVGTGPGNFTGTRISVAAARGLAMSLDVRAIGVTRLEAQAFGTEGVVVSSVAAPREALYVQVIGGTAATTPDLVTLETLPSMPTGVVPTCIGAENDRIAALCGGTSADPAFPLAEAIARAALARKDSASDRPAPLYIRPADAAPPREAPPVILP
jgi:tRNA threonylcarbamoyladenosine biosynthesis protein TsaB